MTKFTNTFRNMQAAILLAGDRFRHEAKGVAAVEFAFIAPIMLLLFVGTIELSAGVSVNRKLSRLSSTVSDLVTQSQTLTENDIENIMDVSAKIMHPYEDTVQIVINLIEIKDNQSRIYRSFARNDTPEAVGSTYIVPAKIKKNDTTLVAAVVKTSYTPSFGWAKYSSANGLSFDRTAIQMSEEIFLRPRIGTRVNID